MSLVNSGHRLEDLDFTLIVSSTIGEECEMSVQTAAPIAYAERST